MVAALSNPRSLPRWERLLHGCRLPVHDERATICQVESAGLVGCPPLFWSFVFSDSHRSSLCAQQANARGAGILTRTMNASQLLLPRTPVLSAVRLGAVARPHRRPVLRKGAGNDDKPLVG